jgi:hypothetical protein
MKQRRCGWAGPYGIWIAKLVACSMNGSRSQRIRRGCWKSVRYTFCPLCLGKQRVIHARWDWSVACITLCDVHQTPLLDECPAFGETDPLSFSGVDLPPDVICRSCYKDLACDWPRNELAGETRQAVDGTYRASLLGVDPGPEILGKSTAQQFRAFIEDLHQVLRHKLNLLADCRRVVPVSFSRHDISSHHRSAHQERCANLRSPPSTQA